MGLLEGKVAIVTGAGRGLGRAYALKLARLGAHVAVVDVDLQSYKEYEREKQQMAAKTTADEIRELGAESISIEASASDLEAMKNMTEKVASEWGQVDILVCNAGGGSGDLTGSRASELDPEDLDTVVNRNLVGTVHSCVAVAPFMKRQSSGKIVTVSSQAGVVAKADGAYAHYGTAKAGIVMYTRYLAQDLGPYGINVNCVAPGHIGTGRLMAGFEKIGVDEIESRIALRRIGTVEDCAKVVEFLCTHLSDYVTGAVVPVDGGVVRNAT